MLSDKTVSLAPMLKLTDRHFRYFVRQIARDVLLYTEMIPANAIACKKGLHLLEYNNEEKPLVLQLGGSDVSIMSEAARIVESYGYNEININAGCPSDRVAGAGAFGASLIKDPVHLSKIFEAMSKACSVPITIKTRIGIAPNDNYENLSDFIKILSDAGCKKFIIHARSAVLKKLSPKQNRKIVPLRSEVVYQIKQSFPELKIIVNGGIKTKEDALNCINNVDGIMIGEAAYKNPMLLADIYNLEIRREDVVAKMVNYIEKCEQEGIKAKYILRHMFGLFYGTSNASRWKKGLMAISRLDKLDKNRLIELI